MFAQISGHLYAQTVVESSKCFEHCCIICFALCFASTCIPEVGANDKLCST